MLVGRTLEPVHRHLDPVSQPIGRYGQAHFFWAVPCLVMIIRRLVVHDGSLLGALDRQSSSFYDSLT
jgi:hypothetical protein